MFHRRSFCALLALASASAVSQQRSAQPPVDPVFPVDAVVVTGSRTEQRMRDALPHVTVITPRAIRDSQAVDLPSLLRTEAGFQGEGAIADAPASPAAAASGPAAAPESR